jgi:hypothetical protein
MDGDAAGRAIVSQIDYYERRAAEYDDTAYPLMGGFATGKTLQ